MKIYFSWMQASPCSRLRIEEHGLRMNIIVRRKNDQDGSLSTFINNYMRTQFGNIGTSHITFGQRNIIDQLRITISTLIHTL